MMILCTPPLCFTVSTWPSTSATVVSTVALVIVEFGTLPGVVQG